MRNLGIIYYHYNNMILIIGEIVNSENIITHNYIYSLSEFIKYCKNLALNYK